MSAHLILEAWGFTLIHFCWQAAVLAGLYRLSELALPRLGHAASYVLALGTLVAMPVAALATFAWEVARLMPDAAMIEAAPVAFAPMTNFEAGLTLTALLPWIEAVWLLGVLALSGRTLVGLYMIHHLRKDAQPVPEFLANRFAWAVRQLGLSGKVTLRLHPGITGPFVVGAVRSVIYLPVSAITALTPDQLDAVLAHELEHIRRADFAWNLVQSVIETIFFFHPAVWWLGARLREQRELCCDDAALKSCSDPLTYATALLSLEEQRRAPNALVMALNGQGEGRSLMGRIARMLGEKPPLSKTKTRPHAALALPVILLVLAAFITPAAQVAANIAAPQPLAVEGDELSETQDHDLSHHDVEDHSLTEVTEEEEVSSHGWEAQLDSDAIAADVHAQIMDAKANLEAQEQAYFDVEAMSEHVRAGLEVARAELERARLRDHGIDPESLAAEVRAELAAAKAEIAAARTLNADAIAAQARAEADRHRAREQAQHRWSASSPEARTDDLMETPAPLAGPDDIVAFPSAAAPSATVVAKPVAVRWVKSVAVVAPPTPPAPMAGVVPPAPPAPPAPMAGVVPPAPPAPMPAPKVRTKAKVATSTTVSTTVNIGS